MPEMHLRQPRQRNWRNEKKKKSIGENFKETGRSRYIYENELDKDYFI